MCENNIGGKRNAEGSASGRKQTGVFEERDEVESRVDQMT